MTKRHAVPFISLFFLSQAILADSVLPHQYLRDMRSSASYAEALEVLEDFYDAMTQQLMYAHETTDFIEGELSYKQLLVLHERATELDFRVLWYKPESSCSLAYRYFEAHVKVGPGLIVRGSLLSQHPLFDLLRALCQKS